MEVVDVGVVGSVSASLEPETKAQRCLRHVAKLIPLQAVVEVDHHLWLEQHCAVDCCMGCMHDEMDTTIFNTNVIIQRVIYTATATIHWCSALQVKLAVTGGQQSRQGESVPHKHGFIIAVVASLLHRLFTDLTGLVAWTLPWVLSLEVGPEVGAELDLHVSRAMRWSSPPL